ncbi:metal ABC transporter substrate-binding protein [Anaerococcus degeneri]|uniref:Metal ABC transporter substrate-binding protein n=1 Tax=Anaerococcus degeneri TaxID=361500 RepID=A0ABS7YY37_9FIRM|nr:metal ABC transporter substrate-binding protein [Anaerococcus degeneri]MBP2016037.1 zinc transport system substrate-binding protein [Anaerococcus degeneri]MCA2096365.1 metal ABC transporter substrate-binding protein [Anaerococcus degeneri]
MFKNFKKLFFILALILVPMTSCGREDKKIDDKPLEAKSSGDKKTIYASFYPVAELVKMISGDKYDVKTIIETSEEPHSFELTSQAMKDLSKADLIAYNGAGMESFIDDLKDNVKDDDKFLDLSDGLTLLDSSKEGSDMASINPHTWLSIKNAKVMVDNIYRKLSSMDSDNEKYYKDKLDEALAKFDDLDKKFSDELSKVKDREKYFVVSHAAFNYLADDYGLKQVAVTGISPEEEPSAKDLKTIADFVKEKNIKTIFFEGKATPKVAETLAKNTGTKTSTLYTMENLDDDMIEKGYFGLMQENLKALVESFNE